MGSVSRAINQLTQLETQNGEQNRIDYKALLSSNRTLQTERNKTLPNLLSESEASFINTVSDYNEGPTLNIAYSLHLLQLKNTPSTREAVLSQKLQQQPREHLLRIKAQTQ